MNEETRQAAERYAEAWLRCDPVALAESLAPDATLKNPRLGVLEGERIPAHMRALMEGFPDLAFAYDGPSVVEAPRAAYRWVMTGTNTGSFYGRPPTGNAVRLEGADFIEVVDGRVATVVEYSDTAGFAAQLAGA